MGMDNHPVLFDENVRGQKKMKKKGQGGFSFGTMITGAVVLALIYVVFGTGALAGFGLSSLPWYVWAIIIIMFFMLFQKKIR